MDCGVEGEGDGAGASGKTVWPGVVVKLAERFEIREGLEAEFDLEAFRGGVVIKRPSRWLSPICSERRS